jgi:hypothetical protein
MDKKFRLWNVRSLYRVGSLVTVSRKMSKYKFHLVEAQEEDVRAVVPNLREHTFFYGKGNENHE